jgi:hypothetical protein
MYCLTLGQICMAKVEAGSEVGSDSSLIIPRVQNDLIDSSATVQCTSALFIVVFFTFVSPTVLILSPSADVFDMSLVRFDDARPD